MTYAENGFSRLSGSVGGSVAHEVEPIRLRDQGYFVVVLKLTGPTIFSQG
jgi:hypothetical protein